MSITLRERLRADRAENSIMQTITIAVSSILIASGLITAPGMIRNAQDNNARTDLSNLAFAQESARSVVGRYVETVEPGLPGSLAEVALVSYTLSAGVTDQSAMVCDDGSAYVMRASSVNGTDYFRASTSAATVDNIDDLDAPSCFAAEDLEAFANPAAGPMFPIAVSLGTCIAGGPSDGLADGGYLGNGGHWIRGTWQYPEPYASMPDCADLWEPGAYLSSPTFENAFVTVVTPTGDSDQTSIQTAEMFID